MVNNFAKALDKKLPQMDDNKGTSFICVNTLRGVDIINQLDMMFMNADYQKSIPYNSCIVKSASEPEERQKFWTDYKVRGIKALPKVKSENLIKRIVKRLLR